MLSSSPLPTLTGTPCNLSGLSFELYPIICQPSVKKQFRVFCKAYARPRFKHPHVLLPFSSLQTDVFGCTRSVAWANSIIARMVFSGIEIIAA